LFRCLKGKVETVHFDISRLILLDFEYILFITNQLNSGESVSVIHLLKLDIASLSFQVVDMQEISRNTLFIIDNVDRRKFIALSEI
jgi:hypothetical protein